MAKPDLQLRSSWFEPSVHSAYFQILSRLVASRQLAPPRAFTGKPRLLPLLDFLPMLDAIDVVGHPDAGVDVGNTITAAAHGPMGLAALSSASIADSLETVARFTPIRNRMFSYAVQRTGEQIALVMTPRLSFGDYGRFLQYATLFAVFNIFRAVLEESVLSQATLVFPWPAAGPEPKSPPGRIWQERYGGKQLAIAFPAALAGHAFESADAEAHERVRRLCEEELTKLDGSIGAKVRHFIHREQPNWPSLEHTAEVLGLSRRTLVRRLEDEGLGFQGLLDEARNELACWYLRHTALPLAEISEQLGFRDQAAFSRAFRRWQGLAAREYRACFVEASVVRVER